jgi:hypothetical protein
MIPDSSLTTTVGVPNAAQMAIPPTALLCTQWNGLAVAILRTADAMSSSRKGNDCRAPAP